jgi:hypothetical protein
MGSMRNLTAMAPLERRLAELGWSAAQLRASVRELDEHYDDLLQEALEEGLPRADAEARATRQLGKPEDLAAQLSAVLRQSTWWGRHPVITFCLLPPVMMLLVVALGLGLETLTSRLYLTPEDLSSLAGDPAEFELMKAILQGTWCGTIFLTSVLFWLLARRTGCRLKWALVACIACSLYSCFLGFQLSPHSFSFYCRFSPTLSAPDWLPFLGPLPVAAVAWWLQRSSLKLIPCPERRLARPSRALVLPRTSLLTPSSVIAMLAVTGLVLLASRALSTLSKRVAIDTERSAKIWPAERAETVGRVKVRQMTPLMPDARTISLKPWLNAALADSLGGRIDTNRKDLRELPAGVHVFGGVPFNIEGRLQLAGRKGVATVPPYPARVRNIELGGKCNRIHLLQGADGITPEMSGTTIARLIVHYADGSQVRIPIVAGTHLQNWWGPIYQTAAGPEARLPSAPASELAWTGGNPWLKQEQPEFSLRLYKSTFDNPRPELEITGLDYLSALSDAAPFIVGLTLE